MPGIQRGSMKFHRIVIVNEEGGRTAKPLKSYENAGIDSWNFVNYGGALLVEGKSWAFSVSSQIRGIPNNFLPKGHAFSIGSIIITRSRGKSELPIGASCQPALRLLMSEPRLQIVPTSNLV